LNHLPFEDAREFVHKLGLKKQKEWREYCKSGTKPEEIPAHPERVYKKQWKGLGDWLGTGTIANINRKFLDFESARAHVRALKLKGREQWDQYSKSGRIPPEIPYHPDRTYKKQWKGLGDWLGTGTIANINRKYLDFETARAHVMILPWFIEVWQ
jgi:Integrase repeat unit